MQTKGDVVFDISSSGHCSDTLYHNYNGQFKIYDALHNLLSYFKLGFFLTFQLTERMNILRHFQIRVLKVIPHLFLSLYLASLLS